MGQALCDLAFVAYRHGDHDTAVAHLEDAVGIYRDLDDLWQPASVLVELAAQSAVAGHGTDALRALAESTRLDERIGRLSGRAYTLAVADAVHLARGQTALAAVALGCYDAHPTAGNRPWVELTRSINWLTEIVESTRVQLDPVAVAAAPRPQPPNTSTS